MKRTVVIISAFVFACIFALACLTAGSFTASAGTTEVNVAKGMPYIFENATVHNSIDDTNGKELTDGNIRALGDQPECCGYSGSMSFSLIIDLGKKTSDIKRFALHTTANQSWGVGKLGSIEVMTGDTPDGEYKSVGIIGYSDAVEGEETWGWIPSVYGLTLDKGVSARYIKFVMTPSSANGFGYFWGSEVQVITVVTEEESKAESKAESKEESKAVSKEESKEISEEESKTVSKEESKEISVDESVGESIEESVPETSVEDTSAEISDIVSETASEQESVPEESEPESAVAESENNSSTSESVVPNNETNNTWLLIGICGAVLVIAVVTVLLLRKKK